MPVMKSMSASLYACLIPAACCSGVGWWTVFFSASLAWACFTASWLIAAWLQTTFPITASNPAAIVCATAFLMDRPPVKAAWYEIPADLESGFRGGDSAFQAVRISDDDLI